ncbi:uncharacterized protein [Antedon mediterranea]|uniref:uncharacterized protein n=1 Tax=Antedon mediterranea TaxID=105859 RepID=UPI003AF612AE
MRKQQSKLSNKMYWHRIVLVVIFGLLIKRVSSLGGQAVKCTPIYSTKPNATCWREFSNSPMDECSHKFCYDLNEGTNKCSSPWKKPTIHREHELERIATLARSEFVTQASCTMRLKVNKNTKSGLLFFKNDENCLGLEMLTLSQDSCAVVYLNRALRGYCIWYHNECPKVATDVTVCKREKYVGTEIPTNSPRKATTEEPMDTSPISIEIIIIVAVSANFLIMIVVAFLVSFLLKRSRMTNGHNSLSRNPSNRPLPRVPNEKINHRFSKADSAEFDKWKDESHYMYLSHESLDIPRYHSITKSDIRKTSDYSYPDMEKVKQSLEATSSKSNYMPLMKDGGERVANEGKEFSKNGKNSEVSVKLPCVSIENDGQSGDDVDNEKVTHHRSSIACSDIDGEYSELKPDYYVLEENDVTHTVTAESKHVDCPSIENNKDKLSDRIVEKCEEKTICDRTVDSYELKSLDNHIVKTSEHKPTNYRSVDTDEVEPHPQNDLNHDYFLLEKDGNETEEVPEPVAQDTGIHKAVDNITGSIQNS